MPDVAYVAKKHGYKLVARLSTHTLASAMSYYIGYLLGGKSTTTKCAT